MGDITAKQWFQIASGSISGLITGAALLNPLFGETLALKIVAGLGVLNIILSSVGTTLSGQASQIRDVLAMPGVQKIEVNEKANTTLAQIAVDPTQNKIAPTLNAQDVVIETAKGNTNA